MIEVQYKEIIAPINLKRKNYKKERKMRKNAKTK